MSDLHAQFDALKAILSHLTNKETKNDPVPDALWKTAGVKAGTRLKDIEKKVTTLKKQVGQMRKEEDVEEELGEEAAARFRASGLTLAEFKKQERETFKGEEEEKDAPTDAQAAREKDRENDTKLRDARGKKTATKRGGSDDYDEGQIEGLWEGKATADVTV